MAFSSTVRFQSAVQELLEYRRETAGWDERDILYLTEMILDGYSPLLIEAEIEAEINHRVTWNQCPLCHASLSEDDKTQRFGFCGGCLAKAEELKSPIPLLTQKRTQNADRGNFRRRRK